MSAATLLWATAGGALIGLAASWILLAEGRVAGISGILGGVLGARDARSSWRLSFLAGLLVGGGLLVVVWPETIGAPEGRTLAQIAAAGGLVGYGTRLGSGCTSGHGICGLTRFSPRSLVATAIFMATGMATATILWLLRGAP